mmetsp:Transcript_21270/g.31748  ORF Transcript_21270/g.31748 Transcript_21270/m.31748 type:complete len:222 (+) Transcript_21270:5394-6059(+)
MSKVPAKLSKNFGSLAHTASTISTAKYPAHLPPCRPSSKGSCSSCRFFELLVVDELTLLPEPTMPGSLPLYKIVFSIRAFVILKKLLWRSFVGKCFMEKMRTRNRFNFRFNIPQSGFNAREKQGIMKSVNLLEFSSKKRRWSDFSNRIVNKSRQVTRQLVGVAVYSSLFGKLEEDLACDLDVLLLDDFDCLLETCSFLLFGPFIRDAVFASFAQRTNTRSK